MAGVAKCPAFFIYLRKKINNMKKLLVFLVAFMPIFANAQMADSLELNNEIEQVFKNAGKSLQTSSSLELASIAMIGISSVVGRNNQNLLIVGCGLSGALFLSSIFAKATAGRNLNAIEITENGLEFQKTKKK